MTYEEAMIVVGNITIIGDDCYSIAEYQEAKTKAIVALEKQIHSCKDCEKSKHYMNGRLTYCLEHECYMNPNNYCRDWSEQE